MITRPSKGASRPSCLAMQPNNVELSMIRRERLLAGFNELDDDEKADLLEMIESLVSQSQSLPFGLRHELLYGGTASSLAVIHSRMEEMSQND